MHWKKLLESTQNFAQRAFFLAFVIFSLGSCASQYKIRARTQHIKTIIDKARSFVGTPYRWGGVTKSGVDCSGLLVNAFDDEETPLPRTSMQQAKVGRRKSLRAIKLGDLVFFAMKKRQRKITHVGMVTEIEGKNNVKFIHASVSSGVVESNLYADYYRKRFRFARRVIK